MADGDEPHAGADDGGTPREGLPAGRRYHVDGELVPAPEATVSVRDRGFAYGDAAFETVRVYGGEVFRWDAHAERLGNTCETLALEHGLPDAELRDRIDATLTANDLAEASARLSVTRGVQPGKLAPDPEVNPTVVVTVEPLPRGGRAGEPVGDGPATLRTVDTRRVPDEAIPADAKTHNYLNGILARLELRGTDADEAVMLDAGGDVAEGTTSNLFFVDEGALRTPSLDGPVLPGVTRDTVINLARGEGIPVDEGRFAPAELRDAEEVFLTSSTREVRPVGTVDGVRIGDGAAGPVTELLSRLFDERIERRFYD